MSKDIETVGGLPLSSMKAHSAILPDVASEERIASRQRALVACLSRAQGIARGLATATPRDALLEHVEQLCEAYLKAVLDIHRIRQALQQADHQESRLSIQLHDALDVLDQKFSGSDSASPRDRPSPHVRFRNELVQVLRDVMLVVKEQHVAVAAAVEPNRDQDNVKPTPPAMPEAANAGAMRLNVHLFGEFQLSLNDRPMRRWSHGRGQQVFKYLLIHRTAPVHKERLIEAFWPNIEPRAARNNLNVSIYYLRQELSRYDKTFPFVLYSNECYLLNPQLELWVDAEAFDAHLAAAHRYEAEPDLEQAVLEYRRADALARGEYLVGESTEEWAIPLREAGRRKHLSVLERLSEYDYAREDFQGCIGWRQKMVAIDTCDEASHRRVMECFLKLGQRQMALRQYHLCVETLKTELELAPSVETARLFEQAKVTSP